MGDFFYFILRHFFWIRSFITGNQRFSIITITQMVILYLLFSIIGASALSLKDPSNVLLTPAIDLWLIGIVSVLGIMALLVLCVCGGKDKVQDQNQAPPPADGVIPGQPPPSVVAGSQIAPSKQSGVSSMVDSRYGSNVDSSASGVDSRVSGMDSAFSKQSTMSGVSNLSAVSGMSQVGQSNISTLDSSRIADSTAGSTVGGSTIGGSTVGPSTMGSNIAGSRSNIQSSMGSNVGASTMGSNIAGSTAGSNIGASNIGASSIGGPSTTGSAIQGPSTMGTSTIGSNVGGSAIGSTIAQDSQKRSAADKSSKYSTAE